MFLYNIVIQRVRKIRDFIHLPWELKKKKITEFWHKYGRIYILLFILASVVAFINVYIECQPSKINITQSGGTTETKATNKSGENKPSTPTTSETKATNKSGENKPSTPTTNETKATNKSGENKPSTPTTNENENTDSSDSNKSKKEIIKERRLANRNNQPQSSITDTIGSIGSNMSSALNSGVFKSLGVIRAFFSFIIGIFLFCAAPVVIFYMWMKKLILPLFPKNY